AADVLGEDADALVEGAADDGAAVGEVALVAVVAGALGGDDEAFALAEQDHAAVGLGEQVQEVLQEAAQQRVDVEGLAEVVGDLQDALELVGGGGGGQGVVGRLGVDRGGG